MAISLVDFLADTSPQNASEAPTTDTPENQSPEPPAAPDRPEDQTQLEEPPPPPEGEEGATESPSAEQQQQSPPEQQPASNVLLRLAKEQYGLDFTGKYASDLELLHGLFNAYKLLGKRNEEAKLLQYLRERYGDEGLQALLTGQTPVQQQEAQAAQKQTPPEEQIEYDPTWALQIKYDPIANKWEGPPEVVEKFTNYLQKREQILNAFIKNPKQFLLETLGDEIARNASQVVQQHFYQTQRTAALQQWVQDHANLLFQGGDPNNLSPVGSWVFQLAEWLKSTTGAQDDAAVLMAAGELAKQMLKQQPTPPKPPPPAAHVPPARKKTENLTAADIIKRWDTEKQGPLDLVKVFQMLESQKQ